MPRDYQRANTPKAKGARFCPRPLSSPIFIIAIRKENLPRRVRCMSRVASELRGVFTHEGLDSELEGSRWPLRKAYELLEDENVRGRNK